MRTIAVILLLSGCSYLLDDPPAFERVVFRTQKDSHRIDHFLMIPSNFEEKYIIGDHEKEKDYVFPDSSIIFITDDITGNSFANTKNLKGLDFLTLSNYWDSKEANLEGVQEDGRVWRQKKINGVTVGYLNVHVLQKEKFDSILNSLKSEFVTFRAY